MADYDDDFESYADDFEEDIASPKAKVVAPPPAAPAKSVPASQYSSQTSISEKEIAQLKKSIEIENNEALAKTQTHKYVDRQHVESNNHSLKPSRLRQNVEEPVMDSQSQSKSTQQKRVNKYGTLSSSSTVSMMDPRARRLARLRASSVLDMQEEKFTLLNLTPQSPYDFYLRQLKVPTSQIRQVAVSTSQECRDIEIATDETPMAHKELQFCCGDDTTLLNMMQDVKQRNARKPSNNNSSTGAQGAGAVEAVRSRESREGYSSRMSAFLQRSSRLCEALLVENSNKLKESKMKPKSTNSASAIFDSDASWLNFGTDNTNGANLFVKKRAIVCARFSRLQPNLLITAHTQEGTTKDDDLRSEKALFCIWDINSLGAPSFILECVGTPSCCVMSSTQSFLVAAANKEGSLALWDLRELTALHRDSDCIELGVACGIRTPSFMTKVGLSSQRELDVDQHSAPLTQLESVGDSQITASISQFVSLDAAGVVVLWISCDVSPDDAGKELGVAPWSRVSLIQVKVLRCSISDLKGGMLGLEPNDVATLYCSCARGQVARLHRHDDGGVDHKTPTSSSLFHRANADPLFAANPEQAVSYFSPVSCISTRAAFNRDASTVAVGGEAAGESKVESQVAVRRFEPLVLVGRADGSVDLFQQDILLPLQTWNLPDHNTSSGSVRACVQVKWYDDKASTFVAVDAAGKVYFFDLLQNPYGPAAVDSLPLNKVPNSNFVDMSVSRGYHSANMLAVGTAPGIESIRIRRLGLPLSYGKSEAALCEEEIALRNEMQGWIGTTAAVALSASLSSSRK